MKTILTSIAAAAFTLLITAPALSHHMAEGVVTDAVYEMIEENLILADSPHLEVDLSTIGTGSDMTRVLTVTVSSGFEDEVIEALADAMGQASQEESSSDQAIARGAREVTRESSLDIEISDPNPDGLVTVTVSEDIGQGESQMQ